LGPTGKWPGSGAEQSPDADLAPPAERRNLTRSGISAERGKPDLLLDSRGRGKPTVRKAHGRPGKGSRRKPMLDGNDQDSRCDRLLRSRSRREESSRLPRGLSARDPVNRRGLSWE